MDRYNFSFDRKEAIVREVKLHGLTLLFRSHPTGNYGPKLKKRDDIKIQLRYLEMKSDKKKEQNTTEIKRRIFPLPSIVSICVHIELFAGPNAIKFPPTNSSPTNGTHAAVIEKSRRK
jgi:hypothetical protein